MDWRCPCLIPIQALGYLKRYVVYHFGYFVYETTCGLEFYILDPEPDAPEITQTPTEFTQFIAGDDPDDFRIPFDIIYQIAQGPVAPIIWLLNKNTLPRFWGHPLCEPGLIRLIAAFV